MPVLILAVPLLPNIVLAAAEPTKVHGIDWDLILKALGILVAAVTTYLQVRSLGLADRASLKTDLEILKLIDSEDPNHKRVKRAVDVRILLLYGQEETRSPANRAVRWTRIRIVIGIVWTLGFAYWTMTLVQPVFSWWSLLTGYQTLAGVWLVGAGIPRRRLT